MSRSETRTASVDPEVARLRAALQDQKASAVRGRDADRTAIARELHDSFGQYLTAMELELGAILRASAQSPQIEARLARMRALTAQAQRDMAQIAWQIRPAMLGDMDLTRACEQLIAQWSSRSDLSFDLHVSLGAQELPVFVANTLYRVLQEAITNSVKHADACRIGVILRVVSHEAVLIVEDDGNGFSQGANGPENRPCLSLGLLGIRERLSLVGGSLEIETSPGHGAALLVRVPL
jgi:signal transduction histidine kinase